MKFELMIEMKVCVSMLKEKAIFINDKEKRQTMVLAG